MFCDTNQIRALAPHAKKLTLFDTRESIREKIVAHVPDFFKFHLNPASPEKIARFCRSLKAEVLCELPLLTFTEI